MGIGTDELPLQEYVTAVMINVNARKYWNLGQHNNSLLLLPMMTCSTFLSYVGYEFWMFYIKFYWKITILNECTPIQNGCYNSIFQPRGI